MWEQLRQEDWKGFYFSLNLILNVFHLRILLRKISITNIVKDIHFMLKTFWAFVRGNWFQSALIILSVLLFRRRIGSEMRNISKPLILWFLNHFIYQSKQFKVLLTVYLVLALSFEDGVSFCKQQIWWYMLKSFFFTDCIALYIIIPWV